MESWNITGSRCNNKLSTAVQTRRLWTPPMPPPPPPPLQSFANISKPSLSLSLNTLKNLSSFFLFLLNGLPAGPKRVSTGRPKGLKGYALLIVRCEQWAVSSRCVSIYFQGAALNTVNTAENCYKYPLQIKRMIHDDCDQVEWATYHFSSIIFGEMKMKRKETESRAPFVIILLTSFVNNVNENAPIRWLIRREKTNAI